MDEGQGHFPQPFGKYLLTELLAVGGMAEVYRAKIFGIDGFEKEMVVKKILPKFAQRRSFVQMFVDEAKIAVALTHGNIVPIYELGENGGSYYIAMEYVEGPTALDLLRGCFSHNKALPPAHALYIAAEVAKGLAYAHNKTDAAGKPLGIVHRDINLRNIVITPSGEVKLLDFGIARASTKQHQTASGVIKGTPGYMSPEQAMGLSVDHRSDLYSLGIILHELLTVRRLFRVRDVHAMRALIEKNDIPAPSSLRPELGPEYDALLGKLLCLRPEERFADADALEEALRGLIARSGMAVTAHNLATAVTAISDPQAPDPGLSSSQLMPIEPGSQGMTLPGKAPVNQLGAGAAQAGQSAGPGLQLSDSEVPFTIPPPAPPPRLESSISGAVDSGSVQVESSKHDQFGDKDKMLSKTSVLAQNADLGWAQRIGDDAELLAIAKASGLKPPSLIRSLLPLVGAVLLSLGVLAFVGREQIPQMWRRVVDKRELRLGSIIVKTFPAGAKVRIDGKDSGLSPMRIDNLDVEIEHQIEVIPVGGEAQRRNIGPGDWEGGEDGAVVEIRIGYDQVPEGKLLQTP